MICKGDLTDHCCYLGPAGVCPLLREDMDESGRRWQCSLFEKHGNWEDVHTDPAYLEIVQPFYDANPELGSCGGWPRSGEKCATCGVTNDG